MINRRTKIKEILLITHLLILQLACYGQDLKFFNQRPKKNLFVELGGNGGLLSLNHEKIHLISFKLMLVYKIGLGCTQDYSFKSPENYFISLPGNLTLCFGKRRVLFELGLGATVFLKVNDPVYEFSFYPIIGYRFQPLKANKLFLKATISLPQNLGSSNFSISNSEIIFVPIGISIGKSF